MPGRVFLPWALAFTAIYVVSAWTGVLHCFGLRLLFFFVFLFQVFRMASLARPDWNLTRDNIAPKLSLLFSSFDTCRTYIAL